jgi:hypothetical protein
MTSYQILFEPDGTPKTPEEVRTRIEGFGYNEVV